MIWAKITLICLYALCLGTGMSNHGKYKKYNFFHQLIAFVIIITLLALSGFFKF